MTRTRGSLPIASGRTAWQTGWRMLRPRAALLTVAFALLALAATAALLVPFGLGRLVDAVTGTDADVPGIAIVLAGGVVGSAVFGAGGMIALSSAVETGLARLREQFLSASLSLPPGVVDDVADGELVSRATDDIETVGEVATGAVPALAGASFAVAMTAMAMGALHPLFLGALLAVAPVHLMALRGYLRKAPRIYAAERRAVSARSREILAAVRALPTLQAFGWTELAQGRIGRESWNVLRWSLKTREVQNRLIFRMNMAEVVGMVSVLLAGAWLVFSEAATVGEVTTAALLFMALFAPFGALLLLVDDLQSAAASLTRVVGVIEVADALPDPSPVDVVADAAVPAILLAGLRAAYPGRPDTLHGIDLAVPAGQWIAVVGASGAGKTTLARTLTGALEPRHGSVRVAGIDPAAVDEAERASRIVMVGQDVHVFSGSLRENLRVARADATDDTLTAVLRTVGGEAWQHDFAQGLDTMLGDGHDPVGRVAAHRIALAQVMIAGAPIVVLDEATADADTSDARRLDAAARRGLAGRTVLVIAHRLSQAREADRVVVLEEGRIVADGTHGALLAAGGAYASLWEAWAAPRSEA